MSNTGNTQEYKSWVTAGGLALAAAAIILTFLLSGKTTDQPVNAFWFVGLLILTMAALSFTAMVFRGMGLANDSDAFGLPSGSIRTLLAIGIMVLLVVFGLSYFRSLDAFDIEMPASKASDKSEIKRLQDEGFIVLVMQPGTEASAKDATPVVVATPAKVKLLRGKLPAEVSDAQKQLLTSIVTLLTTVIGFYFGSKGAADGQRDKAERTDKPDASTTSASADAKALDDDFSRLESRSKSLDQRLDKLNAVDPAAASDRQAVTEAIKVAVQAQADVAAAHKRATDAMTALHTAASTLASTGPESSARAGADTALKLALDQARRGSAALAPTLAALEDAIGKAEKLYAKH